MRFLVKSYTEMTLHYFHGFGANAQQTTVLKRRHVSIRMLILYRSQRLKCYEKCEFVDRFSYTYVISTQCCTSDSVKNVEYFDKKKQKLSVLHDRYALRTKNISDTI